MLGRESAKLPPSESLLQPLGDRPPPNRQEAFEHALQLRMTQLTLTEFVKGPEGTGDEWVEVFQWFSEKREVGADDRKFHPVANLTTGRKSIDSRRPSQMRPTFMYSGLEKRGTSPNPMTPPTQFPAVEEQPKLSLALAADSIPIMVTPASPMGLSAGTTACILNGLGRRLVCILFFTASVLWRLTPGYRHLWFTWLIPLPSVIHPPSPAPEYLYLPARRIIGRGSAAPTVAPPARTYNYNPTPEEPGGEGPSAPQQPLADVVCHFPTKQARGAIQEAEVRDENNPAVCV